MQNDRNCRFFILRNSVHFRIYLLNFFYLNINLSLVMKTSKIVINFNLLLISFIYHVIILISLLLFSNIIKTINSTSIGLLLTS